MTQLPDLPERDDWRGEAAEQGPTLGARIAFLGTLAGLALVFFGTLLALDVDLSNNKALVSLGCLAFVVGAFRAYYVLRDRREERRKPIEQRVADLVDADRKSLPFGEGRTILGSTRAQVPTEQEDGTWRVYNLADGGHACYCPSTESYRLSRGGGATSRFESAAALANHLAGSRRLTQI